MQNKDFWSEDEVEGTYDRFLKQWKGEMTLVHWLYKNGGDTALAFDIGQLVQVMTNLHGEGMGWKYGVVTDYKRGGTGLQVYYPKVTVRFANGSSFDYEVKRKPKGTNFETKAESGDIRPAEIPEDVVRLMLPKCGVEWALEPPRERCPFKDEWKTPVPPCMRKEEYGE